jgi:hypothetical protein
MNIRSSFFFLSFGIMLFFCETYNSILYNGIKDVHNYIFSFNNNNDNNDKNYLCEKFYHYMDSKKKLERCYKQHSNKEENCNVHKSSYILFLDDLTEALDKEKGDLLSISKIKDALNMFFRI